MGASRMRRLPEAGLLTIILAAVFSLAVPPAAIAQAPYSGLGRTPTPEEVRAWDIAISPNGKELLSGAGNATQGASLFVNKCAKCHGLQGEGRNKLAPRLIKADPKVNSGGEGPNQATGEGRIPTKSTGVATWPFATAIWDYINRAMPYGEEGSLKPDEVYALTAFLLYKNGIIEEGDIMDAHSLPKVPMPKPNGKSGTHSSE
jgi:mono/diheme cytochrome c family protein